MIKYQEIFSYILYEISIITVILLLSSCSTMSIKKNISSEVYFTKDNISFSKISHDRIEEKAHSMMDIRSRIMNQYANWRGVRYRFGGNSKKGIDCSAFVQRTFRDQFGLELPRSTYEQQKQGKFVTRSNLRIGDIVLFQANPTSRHVGIYIGNNKFVHASTSNGVTISNLNAPYWKKRYNKARRILTRS